MEDKTGEEILVAAETNVVQLTSMDPTELISKGKEYAQALVSLVEEQKMFTVISSKKFVHAEGWSTLGAMLGVFPFVEYSKRLERDDEITYETRILLRTADGKIMGAGEGICSSKEKKWAHSDEYAIKSMSQTRATGKAFRLCFSWIVKLAGYEPTPAEEISEDMFSSPSQTTYRASEKQLNFIRMLMKQKGASVEELEGIIGKKIDELTSHDASRLIEKLKDSPAETKAQLIKESDFDEEPF